MKEEFAKLVADFSALVHREAMPSGQPMPTVTTDLQGVLKLLLEVRGRWQMVELQQRRQAAALQRVKDCYGKSLEFDDYESCKLTPEEIQRGVVLVHGGLSNDARVMVKGKKDGNVYVQVRSPPAATPGSHEIPSLASNRSPWRTHADGRCSRRVLFAERGRV